MFFSINPDVFIYIHILTTLTLYTESVLLLYPTYYFMFSWLKYEFFFGKKREISV